MVENDCGGCGDTLCCVNAVLVSKADLGFVLVNGEVEKDDDDGDFILCRPTCSLLCVAFVRHEPSWRSSCLFLYQ
jgi:hypothetical protein